MRHTSRLRAVALAILLAGGLTLPAHAASPPPAPASSVLPSTPVSGSSAPVPTATGLERALGPLLTRAKVGAASAVVVDAATGDVLFGRAADRVRIPASTIKVLTAAAALTELGPRARIETKAVVDDAQARVPVVTLIGGGDATLSRSSKRWASLSDLADQVAKALATDSVAVQFDARAFTGPALSPSWPSSFPRAGIVAPVTALMVDHGRARPGGVSRVAKPARKAAEVFAALLAERGITVRSVRAGQPAPGATVVGSVRSPAMSVLVQEMLTESDNDLAESLARLAATSMGEPASFEGASAALTSTAAQLDLPTGDLAVADGSGLSSRNRVTPRMLATLLAKAARDDATLSPITSGLAVAGFTGTLADRFTTAASKAARGVVRAKTGTLTGVSSLAGTVRDADGRVLTFAVLGNKVTSSVRARASLDAFAARLAECGCR